jgi:alpha-tubulin suppressor-like RCC1 family protein
MTIKAVATVEAPTFGQRSNEDVPEAPLQVVLATSRLCVRADGRVYCHPQSGPEPPLIQEKFQIAGVDDAVYLAGGRSLLCVVTRRGTVMCAGSNDYGELGARSDKERSDSFLEVVGLTHAKRVSVGTSHACATLDDKSVRCWGKNESGQTGSDTYYHPEARQLVRPTLVPGVQSDNVAAGNGSSCARTLQRHVVCWGFEQDRTEGMKNGQWRNERPTRLPDLDDVSAIYSRDEGYCAIRRGQILCWGDARRLIPGTEYFGSGVVSVPEIKDAREIALSDSHACALHGDGRVSCFGYPYTYALGHPGPSDPQKEYEVEPAALVEDLPRAKLVATGGTQSCALTQNDDLYCWGRWHSHSGPHDEVKPVPIRLR